jgi:hypothetical protein
MEKALATIKASIIDLGQNECGISRPEYDNLYKIVKNTMGPWAATAMSDDLEVDHETGSVFFPLNENASRTWGRMLVAYREEKEIDKAKKHRKVKALLI